MEEFQGLAQGQDEHPGEEQLEEVVLHEQKTLIRTVIAASLMVCVSCMDKSRGLSNTQMIYQSYVIISRKGSSKRNRLSTNGSII